MGGDDPRNDPRDNGPFRPPTRALTRVGLAGTTYSSSDPDSKCNGAELLTQKYCAETLRL